MKKCRKKDAPELILAFLKNKKFQMLFEQNIASNVTRNVL